MTYGLIFSAGKETRFDDSKPKALSMIGDVCLLDHNIGCLAKCCDKVYVVCNQNNKEWFASYDTIVIDSGYGCGDAVFKALDKLHNCIDDDVFIAWGDCILCDGVLAKTKESAKGHCFLCVPCSFENDPYVRLEQHGIHASVEFKKYGEVTSSGLHDFGVFYGRCQYIYEHVLQFHEKIWDVDAQMYIHKHNNEMQFLDMLNETDIDVLLLPIEDVVIKSFNTKEELKEIRL